MVIPFLDVLLQRLNLFRTVQNNESFKTFPWNRFSALRIFLDDIGWWLTLLSLAFVWSGLRQGAVTRAIPGRTERKKEREACVGVELLLLLRAEEGEEEEVRRR